MINQLFRSSRVLNHVRTARISPAVHRSLATIPLPQQALFQEKGLLDENGLTQFDTLHEMVERSCEVFAPKQLFGTYSEKSNQFEWMTYAEYGEKVHACRSLLKDLGVGQYDKIAIISNNRWEWATIAAAAYSLNANLVPMYEAQLPQDWTYILNDSQAKLLFCSNQAIFEKVNAEVKPNTPLLSNVLSLDDGTLGGDYHFSSAMEKVHADTDGKYVVAPSPEDLANLIYTSGTTGKPKGVELTHLNFTSNAKSAARTMVTNVNDFIRPDDRSLAFLPWAHSYGQTCELWMAISHGFGIGVCRGVPSILEDLQLVKPSILFAVPTLYKKIYDGVHNMMEQASPLRKRLMKSALELGGRKARAAAGTRRELSWLESLQSSILDRLVLSKIRARFGGNLRHGFVAGAACPAEVLHFMDSVGIPICEGYGLSETSPIICINTPEQRRVGSVGRPIGGVNLWILGDDGEPVGKGKEGEICCSGPNVMRGYYKNPEATSEVISLAPDGSGERLFHTGDLGRQEEDGYVFVTGRLKEQYKLENGKYVVPTPIEESISMSRFISQVVLCGANRPSNVALIVPDWVSVRMELNLDESLSDDELVLDSRVRELLDKEIASNCKHLKKFEVPTSWAAVAPFTAANGQLTPKMSIRRHKVIQAYGDVISHLYGDERVVAPAADSQGAKGLEKDDDDTDVARAA